MKQKKGMVKRFSGKYNSIWIYLNKPYQDLPEASFHYPSVRIFAEELSVEPGKIPIVSKFKKIKIEINPHAENDCGLYLWMDKGKVLHIQIPSDLEAEQ